MIVSVEFVDRGRVHRDLLQHAHWGREGIPFHIGEGGRGELIPPAIHIALHTMCREKRNSKQQRKAVSITEMNGRIGAMLTGDPSQTIRTFQEFAQVTNPAQPTKSLGS